MFQSLQKGKSPVFLGEILKMMQGFETKVNKILQHLQHLSYLVYIVNGFFLFIFNHYLHVIFVSILFIGCLKINTIFTVLSDYKWTLKIEMTN